MYSSRSLYVNRSNAPRKKSARPRQETTPYHVAVHARCDDDDLDDDEEAALYDLTTTDDMALPGIMDEQAPINQPMFRLHSSQGVPTLGIIRESFENLLRSPTSPTTTSGTDTSADPATSGTDTSSRSVSLKSRSAKSVEHTLQGALRRCASTSKASTRPVLRRDGKSNDAKDTPSRQPDFFGPGIFQAVLANPITAHQLHKYTRRTAGEEKLDFLKKIDQLRKTIEDLSMTMQEVESTFLNPKSPRQVKLPKAMLKNAHYNIKDMRTTILPMLQSMFNDPQSVVEKSICSDIYPSFVRSQMSQSTARALLSDRLRYEGLGDSFCLTDPRKADNPIVFASDGFINMTGYSRSEVIPRNCRFLQGPETDSPPVRRLKQAIEDRQESFELLLNYKKNGEPFWNLLYVAPLKDAMGKLEFFLGGQINCSTTIHSNVDVMQVLSFSAKTDDSTVPKIDGSLDPNASASAKKKGLFKAIGSKDRTQISSNTGIEASLIGTIEGADIHVQMDRFYSAYSKYLVMPIDTMAINFASKGVIDMLSPYTPMAGGIYGANIFKFLKNHMLPTNLTDMRPVVRAALKKKSAVSVELHLQTRRSALFRGDEKFISHWTPLKDEKGEVQWIIVCLCPLLP